jgi:hypothetical protein
MLLAIVSLCFAFTLQGKAEEWKRTWGLTALGTFERLLTCASLHCLLLRLSSTLQGKAEQWKRT